MSNNGAAQMEGQKGTVIQMFDKRARELDGATAIRWQNETVSYAELNAAASAIATQLEIRNISPGSRVGICMDRTPGAIGAVFGVLRASCTYVPLDPAWPRQRLQLMARAADVTAVIAGSEGRAALGPGKWTVVDPSEAGNSNTKKRRQQARSKDFAYIAFTSGSTGPPKPVGVTHAHLLAIYAAWSHIYDLENIATHLQLAPMSFDVFSGDLTRSLLSGAALVICPRETIADPAELYRLMSEEQVECAEFTPATFMPLARYLKSARRDLGWMKQIIVGSDKWTVANWQVAREAIGTGPQLINSYGTTETTIDATWFSGFEYSFPAPDAIIPIGRPLPGVTCRVVNSELIEVPPGEAGELAIGGSGVTGGYLGDPEATSAKFRPDPANGGGMLYLTGDLARLGPYGFELLGRVDDEVKIGAARVHPAEVERALESQTGVSAAAVVAVPGPNGSPRLAAWVTPITASGRILRERMRAVLPPHAVPAVVTPCELLPVTPAGKIDRQALVARGLPVARIINNTTSDPVTRELARLWCETLGVSAVSDHDDFFELGGDSLHALAVTMRIEKRYDLKLSPQIIYQSSGLEELAKQIRTQIASARLPVPQLNVTKTASIADVVVTGGTGAIGSLITAELIARGMKVAVTGRSGSENQVGKAGFISADLADTELIETIATQARAIVHAAWDFTTDQTNVAAMEALLRGWQRGSGGPLVFLSTTDAARPEMFPGQYAAAKARCQQMLAEVARSGSLPWAALQPAFVWGPRRRFASQLLYGDLAWLTQPLSQGDPVMVPGPDEKSASRHGDGWIDARDLARAAAAALDHPPNSTITCVTDRFSWNELAQTLADLYGFEAKIILSKPSETGHAGMGCGPGQLDTLGITPVHRDYSATLRDTLAAAKQR